VDPLLKNLHNDPRFAAFLRGTILGLRDARSGLLALVRKEISCQVSKDAKS
jgi:hypothetical protein